MNRIITSEVLIAYSQCPRKVFLLLCTNHKGTMHEYAEMIDHKAQENQQQFISDFRQRSPDIQPYSISNLKNGADFLTNVKLQAEGLEATCGLLTKVSGRSSIGNYHYEPTIFVGTHKVSKEQKLALFFAGHVLGLVQNKSPLKGKIVGVGGKSHLVKLENSHKILFPLLESLQERADMPSVESPSVILNKHCPICQFRDMCRKQAEQEDNLSLLDRVTPKVIRKYEKKGIFTVKQLSYLYKPRRRKKRARKPAPVTHKLELQALAIRTGKIYLQDVPDLLRQPVELFLDIEGIPDQKAFYLIGLLICESDTCTYHSFWADTLQDEAHIWKQFLEMIDQYPDAPIYHYGSYEPRALAQLSRRYESDDEALKARLVNVNTYIYGRVYFPVHSNRLKDIGDFIGFSWTAQNASGLQSLVWRHHWDETQDVEYQKLLLTYNEDDCKALMLLVNELTRIKTSADTLSDIDFADQPKRQSTEIGEHIHSQFEEMLRFSYFNYDKKKISFQNAPESEEGHSRPIKPSPRKPYQKVVRKPTREVRVSSRLKCPQCDQKLEETETTSERIIVDLVFTKTGLRKTIIKYWAPKEYCRGCKRHYSATIMNKRGGSYIYGHGFAVWFAYSRLFLRLPYRVIIQTLEDMFNERPTAKLIMNYIENIADYYLETEKIHIGRILNSPFIHVDETPVSILGEQWYIWVFTDGQHVVLKLSETRELTIAKSILDGYSGVIVSDFYGGYDSMQCQQQKCWVHLIREMNNDLWSSPFDSEYETFIFEVKNLIIPIMETVQKYGLKRRNLAKFIKQVDQFYNKFIVDKHYNSDLVLKYQNRFKRYRNSLFTFLEQDGIPWHNNTAERAIKHIALQRKISRFFGQKATHPYLLLLGIMQTCRFQEKSFLRFLLSGEKDIANFKKRKPIGNFKPK